jgi:hypothetical protein
VAELSKGANKDNVVYHASWETVACVHTTDRQAVALVCFSRMRAGCSMTEAQAT